MFSFLWTGRASKGEKSGERRGSRDVTACWRCRARKDLKKNIQLSDTQKREKSRCLEVGATKGKALPPKQRATPMRVRTPGGMHAALETLGKDNQKQWDEELTTGKAQSINAESLRQKETKNILGSAWENLKTQKRGLNYVGGQKPAQELGDRSPS